MLQPHLQSFLPVQDKYLQESDRFIERGWTACWVSIPLVPYFCAACGSVCRPLEPDRPRCTNDAGAPRRDVWDDDGIRVVPLNEAISESWWPKEVKPSALDVMIVMRVLQEAAQALGETIFCICDDYKSFFNQLRLSPSEYCKTGAVHPPRAGQQYATFAYDRVLGFGLKMASNIAQRFADFLVHVFKKAVKPVMEQIAERLCQSNAKFKDWWASRSALGEWQATLVTMLMYCDDPIIICVGAEMTHRALKVWDWMAKSGNTMMAIPEKRTLGMAAKWIGIKFFVALGVSAVTAQKVLRAFTSIEDANEGSLNRDQYRSLIGFLEHVRGVLFLRGDKMYGLYEPLNWALEPMEKVQLPQLAKLQLSRFKHRLSVQAGSSVEHTQAFLSGKPMAKINHSLPARRWAVFNDAAKEGTDAPGLGGWTCGYVWRAPLTEGDLTLHISLLEAIAAVVNVVCAHKIIGGTEHLPQGVCIEVHIDAQATAQVLIMDRAKSPAMSYLHRQALRIPEFVEMLPFLLVKHVFGLGNIASDAASRGYDDVLRIVAENVGVRLLWMDEPHLARSLLDKCLDWRGKQKHDFCWGFDGTRVGEASHPGPTYTPVKRSLGVAPGCQQQDTKRHKSCNFTPVSRGDTSVPPGAPSLPGIRFDAPSSTPVPQRPAVNEMSVQSLALALWSDQSPHAICRGNFDQLLQACGTALNTAAEAFSLRTAKQDIAHWKAWSAYCKTMSTDPMRPIVDPHLDRVGYLREVVLLVNALVFFMKTACSCLIYTP